MRAEAKEQTFIFGIHALQELLRAKRRTLRAIYTTKPEPKAWATVAKHIASRVPIYYVSRDKLTTLAGSSDHQGIIAVVDPFPLRKKPFDPKRSPLLLLLDGIQDPRNLGAIIRSAYCTNFDGIVIVRKQSAPLSAVAIKASAGLAEHMEIYETATALQAAQELKALGYHLYLAALGGKDIREVAFQTPLCIVIGSEAVGISQPVLKLGERVMLAQKEPDTSYNASVAAGIFLFTVATLTKKI